MIAVLSLWATIPTVTAAQPLSTGTAPRSSASFVQSGNTQWSWQNPLPQGNALSSVSCPTTASCVAVGDASTVIATQDGGTTWAGQHAGPGSDRPDLDGYLGVSCPGSTTCFAVRPAGIEGTSNGGATWASQSSVPATAISCATTVNCIATTKTSNMAITTDGGANWSLQPSGISQSVGSVSCPSATTCYAVGDVVIKTVDGGNSWSTQRQLTSSLQSISCANLSSCVAVGLQHVLTTTDGGTTWVDHAPQAYQLSVSCPSPSTCYAVGSYQISATTDGGNSWVAKSATASLRGINCPNTTTCLAVGDRGGIVKTADGGTTWTLQSSGTMTTLAAVSCPTANVCFAVGGGYLFGETATIMATADGGTTWSTKQVGTTATQRLAAVSCASATFCLAVGQGDSLDGLILRTIDGGVTWTRQMPSFTTHWQEGVSCPTVNTCFVVGGGGILRTSDGGATWTLPVSSGGLFGISCPTDRSCIAVGGQGLIMGTTDGQTWSRQNSANGASFRSISCPAPGRCFALSPQGVLLDTVDGGNSWGAENVYLPQQAISCSSPAVCVSVGNRNRAYVTTNGGATWAPEELGTFTELIGLSCLPSGSCLGVGSSGTILRKVTPSGVVANPAFVAADGSSPSTVTVTIRDALGEPAPGKTVSLAQSGGPAPAAISPASAVTDAAGVAVFSVSASTGGRDTFTATNVTDGTTVAQTVSVTFVLNPYSAGSAGQYALRNNDGATWSDIDQANLSLRITPAVDSTALVGGNIDLWTANAGYNQDVGIAVSGGSGVGAYPTVAGQPEAWKESGGFAGTFSPNAAFVQAVVPMKAGNTYTVWLQWKANKSAFAATLFAGAGPIGTDFSTSRLTAQLIPTSSGNLQKRVSTAQPTLVGSDGSTWADIDPALSMSFTAPAGGGTAIIGGNADLWTTMAGFNQDIGISVVDRGSLPCTQGCQPVAWKESGGFAGTYSPNAAFVQTTYQMTAGHVYQVKLQWKANRSSLDATIVAGAGSVAGRYSPTLLSLLFVPSGTGVSDAVSTSQFSLVGSNGINWQLVDFGGSLTLSIPAQATICQALVSANADLWTQTAGYNQDLGIFVDGGLVAWKESGGIAGSYSPNAAFVQTVVPIAAATAYQIQLKWKTNRQTYSGATIFNGAGPIGPNFSPTRLTVQLIGC